MRRVLFWLAAIAGVLSGFAQAQTSLSVGQVNAAAGTNVVVPIHIDRGQNASAVQFTVQFDPGLLTLAPDSPLRGTALVDHALAVGRQDGEATFVIFSPSLTPFLEGSNDLTSVVFEVSEAAAEGASIPLVLTNEEGSDDGGAFVTVIGSDGSIKVGDENNLPSEGQNELIFPQIANGNFGAGSSFAVLVVLVNRTESPANGNMQLFKSDGSAFEVTLKDGTTGSAFPISVAPGGSTLLATDGNGELSAGYARLSSTAPLGGILVFTTRDSDQDALAEAAVTASTVDDHFSVPVLLGEGGVNTGIAFVNIFEEEITITLNLKNSDGASLEQQQVNLSPGQHLPRFVNQLFDALVSSRQFEGVVEMSSQTPFSAVALKTQGNLLTTFPVVVLP